MNARNLATLLLLMAAVLTSWLAWQLRPQPAPDAPGPPRSDYSLDTYDLVVLDAEGHESFTVRGPILSRDPYTAQWFLNEPRFSFPVEQGEPWTARSGSGWVSAHAEEIRLSSDVEILGPGVGSAAGTRLHTAALAVFPDQHLARSADVVTITRAASILRGKGLEANFQTREFKLLADVRARYDMQ